MSWSGPHAWKIDVLRAVVSAGLAVFALWSMDAMMHDPLPRQKAFAFFRLSRSEWLLLAVILFLLMFSAFSHCPKMMELELARRGTLIPPPQRFDQITRPYIPYFFYMLGFWLGIGFPHQPKGIQVRLLE